jgi:hypothetical protein
VYNVLVWRGKGRYGGFEVEGGVPGRDELLVTHAAATSPLTMENTGTEDLIVFKFFGPDINTDIPYIPAYPPEK